MVTVRLSLLNAVKRESKIEQQGQTGSQRSGGAKRSNAIWLQSVNESIFFAAFRFAFLSAFSSLESGPVFCAGTISTFF